MAKDTEKLIRQLSLISYPMAERRPVTALEIRRDVEGYSGMNEDAYAAFLERSKTTHPLGRVGEARRELGDACGQFGQLRFLGQGHGDLHAPPLAARKRVRAAVEDQMEQSDPQADIRLSLAVGGHLDAHLLEDGSYYERAKAWPEAAMRPKSSWGSSGKTISPPSSAAPRRCSPISVPRANT